MQYLVTNPQDDNTVRLYINRMISEAGGSISQAELQKKTLARFGFAPLTILNGAEARLRGIYKIDDGKVSFFSEL